jgi:YHS domain-containing protein
MAVVVFAGGLAAALLLGGAAQLVLAAEGHGMQGMQGMQGHGMHGQGMQGMQGMQNHAMPAAVAEATGDPYLLTTDPVTGDKLGKTPVILQHEGRELRFASQANADKFKADPKTYLDKVDKELVKQQSPLYALKTCVVLGEKLGGDTVNYIHNNRLVRLCCEDCVADFKKDPAKYLKKIDEATIAAQKAKYPLKTCVVGGGKLGEMGAPVDLVLGNRLVRLCCNGCVSKLKADPAASLSKLDEAAKK